jgi:hypothetical protein
MSGHEGTAAERGRPLVALTPVSPPPPQPSAAADVRRVLRVHRMPPHRLPHGHRLKGTGQHPHRGRSGRSAGQAFLDHRDPSGALDHVGQQLEGLHGDLHPGTDADHAELAGGRGVVGALVDGPGQPGQMVEGEFVADLGVVVGDQAQPAVLVEVDGGETVDDAVRHQQSVDRAQDGRGVLHDAGGRVLEDEPDPGRLLMQGAGERRTEHGRAVVGGEEGELPRLGGRIEVGLAGEDPLQQVARGGAAVAQGGAEHGQFVGVAGPRQQFVVELAAQPRGRVGTGSPGTLASERHRRHG